MFVGLRYIANVTAFSVLKSSVDINIIGSYDAIVLPKLGFCS